MKANKKRMRTGFSKSIRVGPAGWSYADWDGIVYPRPRPRGFHEAEYLAQFFDTIEINTSFYQPLRAAMTKLWVTRVERNADFKFTAKLWRRFTHERQATHQDEKTFKAGLAPLVAAGRLGALLVQFPWSFKNTRESREYLGALVVQFMEYPLVVEVRHASWNQPEIFQLLADLGVGFCNIDQPLIGRSIGPSERATAAVGYVRLHGRNYEQWFSSADHPEERYNYLYSVAELEPWAERIKQVARQAEVTYVIANNHFEGKAIVNALQLTQLISHRPIPVPQSLAARYPELQQIAAPDSEPRTPQQTDLLFEAPATANKV
jgi:uncharacterized protein YecE (DUF72 family)